MVINFDPYGSLYVARTEGSEVRKYSIGSTTPVIIVGSSGAIAFDSSFNLDVPNIHFYRGWRMQTEGDGKRPKKWGTPDSV